MPEMQRYEVPTNVQSGMVRVPDTGVISTLTVPSFTPGFCCAATVTSVSVAKQGGVAVDPANMAGVTPVLVKLMLICPPWPACGAPKILTSWTLTVPECVLTG